MTSNTDFTLEVTAKESNLDVSSNAVHTVTVSPTVAQPVGYTVDLCTNPDAATADSVHLDRVPSRAFDDQISNYNGGYIRHTADDVAHWLQYDFGAGNEKRIEKYTLEGEAGSYCDIEAPKQWEFQGSNDGTNWITLDTRSNISGWQPNVKNEFIFDNPDHYRYYRWNGMMAFPGNGNDTIIGEAEMMEAIY